MNILGLFDGMSCGQIALERLNIKVDNYYASEIDKYPIAVTQHHYPNTVQLGNVTKYAEWDLPKIDLILAGFSCQPYSIAGKRKGTADDRGGPMVDAMLGAIEKFQPAKFMLENVKGLLSIEKGSVFKNILVRLNNIGYAIDWKIINSALVSAQNRERIYIVGEKISKNDSFLKDGITMFDSKIKQPEDKGIVLKDIIENGVADKRMMTKNKSFCLTARYNGAVAWNSITKKQRTMIGCIQVGEANLNGYDSQKRVCSDKGKSPCLTSMKGGNLEPKIAMGAFRGRYDENQKIKQKLEVRKDNKSNTPTTVQKDNIVVEQKFSEGTSSLDRFIKNTKNEDEKANCLTAIMHKGMESNGCTNIVQNNYWRKLLPVECEKLQTVDNNWTLVPWQKRMMSNSRRYSMLGNGWTIDVVAHILKTLININKKTSENYK